MVDISKIKKGDKVTFGPYEVIGHRHTSGIEVKRVGHSDNEWLVLPVDMISEHIPAPREFKVGDRVAINRGNPFGWTGVIKFIDGDEFFVRASLDNKPSIVSKRNCSHID